MDGKVLRCYAEQVDSGWEAICVDLDLAVQGDTFEAVQNGLLQSISLYLETVSELPSSDQKRLLKRKAPFALRMKYALKHLRYFIRGTGRRRHDFVTTPDACPV